MSSSRRLSPQALLVVGALTVVAVALLAAWVLRGPAVDRTKVYRIGYGNDVPLHFKGPDGSPAGLAVELVQESARRKGIQLEWVNDTGFNQERLDLWVLQTLRPDRPKMSYMSEPYLQAESCFLVLANSPIRDMRELRQPRVSHINYASLRDMLPRLLPGVQSVPTTSSQEALTKMIEGQADAAFIDQYALVSTMLSGVQKVPVRILPSHSAPRQMAIAGRLKEPDLADELREGMQSMLEDGTLTKIAERWAFFPSLTTDVIGDLGNAKRRARSLGFALGGLSVLLAITVWLVVLSQRRSNQVRRAETLLRNIADRVPGMVYQFRQTSDGRSSFPYASEKIRQVFRLEPAQVREDATKAFSALHPDDLARVNSSIEESARELKPWICEYRVLFEDGTERWHLGNAAPQREPDGSTLWHGFITDITDRKAAEVAMQSFERKIQETQKLESLGVLAGGIAHDFNNLLTGILGNTTLAGLEVPASSPVQSFLESIRRASMRAADLCKQMLAYSGRGQFVVKNLSLNGLVEETAQMLKISVSKQAELKVRLAPSLPAIEADATQIRQVIMNLVINASEALGPRGGEINVTTGLIQATREYLRDAVLAPDLAAGRYVFLEVGDNGAGMDEETVARIFDPFFTTKFTGRGLGLSAVLGIVRGHRGALKVHSEPGRGTTFRLLFPCAAGAAEAPAPAASKPVVWRGAGCVLVVDDEEMVSTTASLMVRKLGFEVVTVGDGAEAVEVFTANPARFTLILMDLTMPRMDGKQATEALRQIRPDVKIVLMSGFNEREATAQFAGEGLAGFLQKPFQFDGLSEVLRRAVGPDRTGAAPK